jgi:hypothetical protein
MVNTTDGIGRLIAEEVLLQTERQLLRNRDQPPDGRKEQPAQQPTSPPLSHNDKAVSSVLLTILDEQLEASALASNRQSGQSAADIGNRETVPSPSRIGAQYAEAETAFRPDKSAAEIPIPPLQTNPQAMAASPELRMMMESAFVTAAARLQGGIDNAHGATANKKSKSSADLAPLVRIGGGILAATIILMIAIAFGR